VELMDDLVNPERQGRLLERRLLPWLKEKESDFRANSFDDDTKAKAQAQAQAWISTDKVVTDYGVPRDIFVPYVEREREQSDSCKRMPFALLLVAAYIFVVVEHDKAPEVNAVEDSIGEDVLTRAKFAVVEDKAWKNFNDINSYLDFYSWLTMGLVPTVFKQEFEWSRPELQEESRPEDFYPVNSSMRGVYVYYNRIIGGIRISQERDETVTGCREWAPGLQEAYGMPCVGGQTYEQPEMSEMRFTPAPKESRVTWLYIQKDIDVINSEVLQMELDSWLDKRTQKIQVSLPVYNAEYGIHTLIRMNLFFSRGGHIWKVIIPMSVFDEFFTAQTLQYDIVFCFCLLWMIFTQSLKIVGTLRRKGCIGLIREYLNFWNALDWFSVLGGGAVIMMLGYLQKFISELNGQAEVLHEAKKGDEIGYKLAVDDYYTMLEAAVNYNHWVRHVMAGFPLIIISLLFKSFAAQPRLAIVTRSLGRASIDLGHFLIVFTSIFGIYSIFAVVLYGVGIEVHVPVANLLLQFHDHARSL